MMTTNRFVSFRLLLVVLLAYCNGRTVAYTSHHPELNRRCMAGLWRLLTPNARTLLPPTSHQKRYPMKEFTTYPKKYKEFLLVLNEDGSFQQYNNNNEDDHHPTSSTKRKVKGTWDFIDGQLILAADRSTTTTGEKEEDPKRDTLLVGKVFARPQDMTPSPVRHKQRTSDQQVNATTTEGSSSGSSGSRSSMHLVVPQGLLQVGKFMYPKHHPSFFEQPMFSPTLSGSFQLSQVLRDLNADQIIPEEDEYEEKFRRNVFYDKRFLLTSHPVEHKPKGRGGGRLRWSIKYNKFVEDKPFQPKRQQQPPPSPQDNPIPIRVMEVAFHANHTFSTVAGLGQDTVLRGKWDIIGKQRDQLWMQVWRFGFGRSVSGSVYSEGKGLSHNDAKTYWGEISYMEKDTEAKKEERPNEDANVSSGHHESRDDNHELSSSSSLSTSDLSRLQVIGSAFIGWGLEPQPVEQFVMKECSDEDDDTDAEQEEEDDDKTEENLERLFDKKNGDDNEIDWSASFQ